MASRAVQGVLRTGYLVAKNATKTTTTSINKKFSTQSAVSPSRNTPTATQPSVDGLNTKSAFTTVSTADHGHLHSKFRVPFDENPLQMQENFIEQVESIPTRVQNERGYHIIGKIKAPNEDTMQKILALGDMRIYQ